MASLDDYGNTASKRDSVPQPFFGAQTHTASCKCATCKSRRAGVRSARCANTCKLGLGLGVLVALCCLVWFVADASSALTALANAPSPTSAPVATCPECPSVVCNNCGECNCGRLHDDSGNGFRRETRIPTYAKLDFLPPREALQVMYAQDLITVMRLADVNQAQAAIDAVSPGSFQVVAPIIAFLSASGVALQTPNRAIGDDGFVAPNYRHEYALLVVNVANDELGFVVVDHFSEQPEAVADFWGPDSTHSGRIYSTVSRDNTHDTITIRAKEDGDGGYDVKFSATFANPQALLGERAIDNPDEGVTYFPDDRYGKTVRARGSRYQNKYELCDSDDETPQPECSSVYTHAPTWFKSRGVRVDLGPVRCSDVRFLAQGSFWKVPLADDPSAAAATLTAADVASMTPLELEQLMLRV